MEKKSLNEVGEQGISEYKHTNDYTSEKCQKKNLPKWNNNFPCSLTLKSDQEWTCGYVYDNECTDEGLR